MHRSSAHGHNWSSSWAFSYWLTYPTFYSVLPRLAESYIRHPPTPHRFAFPSFSRKSTSVNNHLTHDPTTILTNLAIITREASSLFPSYLLTTRLSPTLVTSNLQSHIRIHQSIHLSSSPPSCTSRIPSHPIRLHMHNQHRTPDLPQFPAAIT